MTKLFVIGLSALFVLFLLGAALTRIRNGKKGQPFDLTTITRRPPLTDREKKMFQTLKIALPDCAVLGQVAFSALITTKIKSTRNRFDRKVADFVVCNKALDVLAIIELDDASHRGREKQDKYRDALLSAANYQTIRYDKIPSVETIRQDIANATQQLNQFTDLHCVAPPKSTDEFA